MNSPVIVTSGLPRSGTSLMMSMLEAAGVAVVTDELRSADDDNPLGYYEFGRVLGLPADDAWVCDARGKAVKVIYRLLASLPRRFDYRVVFMERAMAEVVASQDVMLARRGARLATAGDDIAGSLQAEVARTLAWIERCPQFAVHRVNYNDLLRDPLPVLRDVCAFLDLGDRAAAMAARIDPALYRNRHLAPGHLTHP